MKDLPCSERPSTPVGELAVTMAHEIRNPLAGISGAIEVLGDSLAPEDDRRAIVDEIREQIRRVDRTVEDLLIYARPLSPSCEEIDLRESLNEAWLGLPSSSTDQIRFTLIGARRVPLWADPQMLKILWTNLFQNAADAMTRGGCLDVSIRSGKNLRIEICDTGPGIEPADHENLFRPFFSTKARGTGLGLAISKKIIEAHGGSISLNSWPGVGSVVAIELPNKA